jgi:hypothetical protein
MTILCASRNSSDQRSAVARSRAGPLQAHFGPEGIRPGALEGGRLRSGRQSEAVIPSEPEFRSASPDLNSASNNLKFPSSKVCFSVEITGGYESRGRRKRNERVRLSSGGAPNFEDARIHVRQDNAANFIRRPPRGPLVRPPVRLGLSRAEAAEYIGVGVTLFDQMSRTAACPSRS